MAETETQGRLELFRSVATMLIEAEQTADLSYSFSAGVRVGFRIAQAQVACSECALDIENSFEAIQRIKKEIEIASTASRVAGDALGGAELSDRL